MDLDTFRKDLDAWLDANADELRPATRGLESLDEQMAQLAKVKRMAYDAGWMRWGWPERVGGLGGPPVVRAYLGEALTSRGLVEPGVYSMTEVLAPTMIDFAPPDLAAEMVPRLLSGEETWCQGFSEPGTGSNLGSLACKATRTDRGWRVNGQKLWTSFAHYAQRCVLLTRTGTPESAHRGITAFFIDIDSPGITVRPFQTQHGIPELCEVFYDDVLIPFDRMLGEENGGWQVAMDLLPYERSTSFWHRGAHVQRRYEELLAEAPPGAISAHDAGEVALALYAFRARSRVTQHRMSDGEELGAETSVDKVLVAAAEQAVYDLVAAGLPAQVILGDDPGSARWRSEFMYSRAATIYGGSGEIQRNIIARRLLDLGHDR